MKVLLIASSLDPVRGKGVGRYTLELYTGLKNHCDVHLRLLSQEKFRRLIRLIQSHTYLPLILLKEAPNYDIVHALVPEYGAYLPIFAERSVVTFHDLGPMLKWIELKRGFNRFAAWYATVIFRLSALSRAIITVSSQTAEEIVTFLNVPRGKIHVINLGVDAKFKPMPKRQGRPSLGFFATFSRNDRVDLAIEVFRRLKSKGLDCQLILAGIAVTSILPAFNFDVSALTAGLDNISLVDYVPESEIVNFYNSFDVFLHTANYEGFGFAVLEAQRCGVPVLVRKDAKIPGEVTAAAIKCADSDEMAHQAYLLLTDSFYHRKVSQAGIEYASQFTWDRTVQQTMAVYEDVVRSSHKNA